MNAPALSMGEIEMVRGVLCRHPNVLSAKLFGSRAKGTHTERSDVDLVVTGGVNPLEAENIAAELDELPLPYQFEVQSIDHIAHKPLLDHIERVGILIYPA